MSQRTFRRSALLAAAVAATGIAGVVTAAPASADRGSCYNRGNFSFVNDYGDGSWRKIDVYRGAGCSGKVILAGRVSYAAAQGVIVLSASDAVCDSIGLTLYTQGPSVSSTGCATTANKSASLGSFPSPRTFWVRVNGTTNSDAVAFPL